jgi:hypothetical protein
LTVVSWQTRRSVPFGGQIDIDRRRPPASQGLGQAKMAMPARAMRCVSVLVLCYLSCLVEQRAAVPPLSQPPRSASPPSRICLAVVEGFGCTAAIRLATSETLAQKKAAR